MAVFTEAGRAVTEGWVFSAAETHVDRGDFVGAPERIDVIQPGEDVRIPGRDAGRAAAIGGVEFRKDLDGEDAGPLGDAGQGAVVAGGDARDMGSVVKAIVAAVEVNGGTRSVLGGQPVGAVPAVSRIAVPSRGPAGLEDGFAGEKLVGLADPGVQDRDVPAGARVSHGPDGGRPDESRRIVQHRFGPGVVDYSAAFSPSPFIPGGSISFRGRSSSRPRTSAEFSRTARAVGETLRAMKGM